MKEFLTRKLERLIPKDILAKLKDAFSFVESGERGKKGIICIYDPISMSLI